MKKLFKRENLLIILIIGLIGHNIYLQTRVEKAIDTSKYAVYAAKRAKNSADDAAYNASNAARKAEDASDHAYDAYLNSFGQRCWSCP